MYSPLVGTVPISSRSELLLGPVHQTPVASPYPACSAQQQGPRVSEGQGRQYIHSVETNFSHTSPSGLSTLTSVLFLLSLLLTLPSPTPPLDAPSSLPIALGRLSWSRPLLPRTTSPQCHPEASQMAPYPVREATGHEVQSTGTQYTTVGRAMALRAPYTMIRSREQTDINCSHETTSLSLVLYCTVLYCTVLNYIIYYTILYHTIPYYTIPYSASNCLCSSE